MQRKPSWSGLTWLTYTDFRKREHGEGWSNLWSNDPSDRCSQMILHQSFWQAILSVAVRERNVLLMCGLQDTGVDTSHDCRMVGQGHNMVWWHVDMKTKLITNFWLKFCLRLIPFWGTCLWTCCASDSTATYRAAPTESFSFVWFNLTILNTELVKYQICCCVLCVVLGYVSFKYWAYPFLCLAILA